MMNPSEFFQGQRHLPARNLDSLGVEVPPYGIVLCRPLYLSTPSRGTFRHVVETRAPLGDSSIDFLYQSVHGSSVNVLAANGPTAIPADDDIASTMASFGAVTCDWPAVALVDAGVLPGSECGTVAGSFTLATGKKGFRCLGTLTDDLGLVTPAYSDVSMILTDLSTQLIPRWLSVSINCADAFFGTFTADSTMSWFEWDGLPDSYRTWHGVYYYSSGGNRFLIVMDLTAGPGAWPDLGTFTTRWARDDSGIFSTYSATFPPAGPFSCTLNTGFSTLTVTGLSFV